jgi:ribokinase
MDLSVTTLAVPAVGQTVLGKEFMTACGGKGANQAVAAARLGGCVSMIGCVGGDRYGEVLLDSLKSDQVDTSAVRVLDGKATGVSFITVKDGDNSIIVVPGANSCLTEEMVDESRGLIEKSAVLLVQLEIPFYSVERAVEIAKNHHVKVIFNPAPARKLSSEFLSKIDVLTPNESECGILAGMTVDDVESAKKAVTYLTTKGVPQVVVTMGPEGVVYNRGSAVVHKCVPKVQVADTTAAGDSFSGALALALADGKGIDDAVLYANAVGTLTVMKKGAQMSLPFQKEVDRYFRENHGE